MERKNKYLRRGSLGESPVEITVGIAVIVIVIIIQSRIHVLILQDLVAHDIGIEH